MSLKSFFYFKIRTSVSIIILIFILIFIWGWFSSSLVLKAGLLPIEQKPDDFNVMCENVSFFTDDNINIKGWFLPSKEKSYKTIIICHGWGTNKSDVLSSTIFFLKRGFNLLYFDFRNHGESGGNKSSLGKLESQDLISAVDFLKTKKKQQYIMFQKSRHVLFLLFTEKWMIGFQSAKGKYYLISLMNPKYFGLLKMQII